MFVDFNGREYVVRKEEVWVREIVVTAPDPDTAIMAVLDGEGEQRAFRPVDTTDPSTWSVTPKSAVSITTN